ncbi:MAG: hypothetical protein JSS11_16355 [Verrucomicrobia bacterium]|nr:hypothetical protein [Verrucomicrobiota bacterium]
MKRSPEQLEKLIHQTLRSVPDRRAPSSLEARVMAAIAERAARPWWRQSYASWPVAVRCGFLVITGGLMKLALMAAFWVMTELNPAQYSRVIETRLTWLQQAQSMLGGLVNIAETLFRSIPPLWLYGGLAVVVSLYVTLFGLGAAAYRTLYAQHR